MRLDLDQRLAPYVVTRPPLGRCTRSATGALAAWDHQVDDGLVVDLVDERELAIRWAS